MNQESDLNKALRELAPATRREFFRRAAALGIAATAANALVMRHPLIVTAAPSAKRGGMV
jgi:hypothetical protein